MRLDFVAAGILCLCASGVYAQDISRDTLQLDEVTVYGQYVRPTEVSKLPVPLSLAPMSVSRMSAPMIADLSATSLIDVTRNLTGVRPNNTYGGFQTFNIRGFNTFVVVTDGIRDERHNLYSSAPNTSLASIESVEVLKGAASVMYGHSALGGVISLVHKQPSSVSSVNAKMTIGSWERYSVEAGASGRIAKGVDFRTDFSMSGGDGWRHTNDRAYNAYMALNFELSHYDNLLVSASAKNDFYGTDTGQPHLANDVYDANGNKVYSVGDLPKGISRRTRYADPKDHLTDKDITVSAKWNHDFKNHNWKLTEYLSYYFGDLDYYATEKLNYLTSAQPVYDHYYMSGDNKTYICLDSIKRAGYQFAYKTSLVQNQLELKGKFNTGSVKHNFLGGYSFAYLYTPRYTANYGNSATGQGVNSVVSAVNPVLNQGDVFLPYSRRNLAWEAMHGVYVQDYMNLNKKLSALVALRYDRFNRTYQQAYTEDKAVTKTDPKAHIHDNALTYRLSLLYQFTKDFNVYASTSNYFKPTRTVAAPGYIYVGSDGAEIKPNGKNVFSPESGYQYEVGSHIALTHRFNANVAAFYILRNNMVQSLGTVDGQNVSGQVGKADSKGFEIDINARPFNCLGVNAGYTYTEARVKEYARNAYAGNAQAGNYLNHAPKHMAYGWLTYDFARALKGLRMAAGFNYSSKAYVNAANTMEFNPYTIANAMVSYGFKSWKMQLNLNNVFDKTYYMTAVSTTGYIPEQGRNFRFSLSFDM